MTGRYRFSLEGKQLISNISVDENVIWSQQETMDNSNLTDTINESYETAEEDNATQYLSVLDSTNMTLDQLNMTLANPKLEVVEEPEHDQTFIPDLVEPGNEDAQKVVLYAVEGSDELYGIQLAPDEEGNLQKYQFQVRQKEDGQLEAIPETIQLLPMEEELEQVNEEQLQIFVQENEGVEETNEESLLYEENNQQIVETVDIKPSILNVKQEIQEQQIEYTQEEDFTTENYEVITEGEEQVGENHTIEYRNIIDATQCQEEERALTTQMELQFENQEQQPQHYIQETIEEQMFEDNVETQKELDERELEDNYTNGHNLDESDLEDYQIVDGVHITASDLVENDADTDENNELALESLENTNTMNILRHTLKSTDSRLKKDNRMFLYVVQHPEKENVDSMHDVPLVKVKTNPRSILKSSHGMLQGKNEIEPLSYDERLSKRFSRGKEAMQARNFHNFINKTTIPQAPVRKDRLPRKQKIKPVERMDEEIVVQEVMVGSNGFQEIDGFNKENLEVTEYVELTDSDDDYDPKKVSKKKRRGRRKRVEIEISDDDEEGESDSHDSVIELDESEEEREVEKRVENISEDSGSISTPSKRRRGRPPKNKPAEDKLESPMKKMRLEETKPEIPCPKCEKTFPSQNSLKTHLQHHNLQTSWNAMPESKYKCVDCSVSFKNSILLNKHTCSAKSFNCLICKKKFGELAKLNLHKRVHAKEQLIKSTTSVPVSPKKLRHSTVAPKSTFKSPQKLHKCKVCGRVCSNLQMLNVHMKNHKEFVCGTCSQSFMSRIMLEKHVMEKCVKSPMNPRRSMRIKNDGSSNDLRKDVSSTIVSRSSNKLLLQLKCEECNAQFSTYTLLFKHRVAEHQLDTPDKSVLNKNKKSLYKERPAHSGIPATKNLRKAFANLKSQLTSLDTV